MKILTSIFLIITLNINCQTKTDKIIITGIGSAITAYGYLKPGCKKQDIYICTFGVLFAAIPYLVEKKQKRFEVSSSGINIKLKYSKKYKSCKKVTKQKQ